MPILKDYGVNKESIAQYTKWREDKDLRAARRQEYLRRNPDAIEDYDMQRVNILLNTVEMMDKSLKENSNKVKLAYESATSIGLGYAAIGGATLGFLVSKLRFVKNAIDKVVQKYPKSKNIISMGIAAVGGVVGVLVAYPAYNFLSDIESKIHRKRKFETMEKELQDPSIFVVLNAEQKEIFKQNLPELDKNKIKKTPSNSIKKEIQSLKTIYNETLHYGKEQAQFREKYKEETSYYDEKLTEKEIKSAKKDKVLLSVLIKELNTKSQSYYEKMQRITDNMITVMFALGSLFSLCYENIAKKMKVKTVSLPAGMGIMMLLSSTFFATWAQKRAGHVGRYKAIQELKQNPERLVYISERKTNTIEDTEIEMQGKQKTNLWKFLREFFKHNREYQDWKKEKNYTGEDISKAMKSVELSPEQLQDGKRLQKNLFKTLYKVDKNTQKYSGDIDVTAESVKYPINLILGTIGSVWGMKHLANLRNAIKPSDIFKSTAKYLGTTLLFVVPSVFINSYFAKAQKMGTRISDMMTMQEMEDYRFFADYSKYET